ncbi:MAG: tetratricopeptide repeat protein [Myxococcota bacterium]|nr:tetratricopeptide repeat protein [Myxococcota bacterium]
MTLSPTLGTLQLWLTLDADALLVIRSAHQEVEPSLIALCRTLKHLRTQGETRPLVALVLPETAPLDTRLDRPEDIAAQLSTVAGAREVTQWMNTTDSWSELLSGVRLTAPPTPAQLRDQLRDDPRTGGLSTNLLFDRLLEAILLASQENVEQLLDAAMLESILEQSRHDLHRWAEWRTNWRRALRVQLLPERQAALSGQPAPVEDILSAPWNRPGRPRLPSQHLRNSRTPFIGQHGVISSLLLWSADELSASSRLVYGPPGSGKSRTMFEVCQILRAQGWTAGFLSDTTSAAQLTRLLTAAGDRLVVVDDAEHRQDTLRTLRSHSHGSGRLRVVALSAISGWWLGERLALQPIPQADRIAHLKLAAASYAEATGDQPPRMVSVPDTALLRWPIGVQLAAILTIHRLPLDDLSRRVLSLEERGWRNLGLDPVDLRARLTARLLGAETEHTRARADVEPSALLDQLLVEQLRAHPDLLQAPLDCQAALLALCRIAGNYPEARGWISTLIDVAPETRLPIALHVARMLSPEPASTPLGPILMATGTGGISALAEPLRGLTVSYTRQAMLSLRDEQHSSTGHPAALAMAPSAHAKLRVSSGRRHRMPPPDLADEIWDRLRERLGVLLPHHAEALKTLQFSQEADRMAALIQLPPAQWICLEISLSRLSMPLTKHSSPAQQMSPSEQNRLTARKAASRLALACGHQGTPPPILLDVTEALASLGAHLDPALPALLESLHQAGSLAGYAAMIAPLEAFSEGHRCAWPHPDTLRADLAVLHCLQGHPHTLPAIRDEHPPSLRLLLYTAQLATGSDPDSVLQQLSIDLGALSGLSLPVRVALLDSIARWHLEHGSPDTARSCLSKTIDGLTQLRSLREARFAPFIALSLHNLGAHLYPLDPDAGLNATLSAAEEWRKLVPRSGEAFLPDLAATLSNVGAMLDHSQRHDEALAFTQKGISICWGGVPSEALSSTPELRNLLTTSAVSDTPPDGLLLRARQHTVHTISRPYRLWLLRAQTERIEEPEEDSVFIGLSSHIWEHHRTPPELLQPHLGTALQNLGGALGSAGKFAAAIQSTAGAVAVLEHLHSADIELAVILDNLSALRGMAGDTEGAMNAAEEAVSLLDAADAPAEHASAMNNLAAALYTLGLHQRAAQSAQEAAETKGVTPSTRMMALFNLGLARAASGEIAAATQALREALDAVEHPPSRIADCYRRLTTS